MGNSMTPEGGRKDLLLSTLFHDLKGVQRPAAFAIACFCFCEFCTLSYSGNCGEQAFIVQ